MTKRCIITFGNKGWYVKGVDRLIISCEKYGVECLGWKNYPPGSPTHEHIPYGFKIFAFLDAIKRGYTSILWCDSSGWLTDNPSPIFDLIDKDGYFILKNTGQYNNWWCSDKQLAAFGYTRIQARTQQHAIGGLIGFNFEQENPVFNEWAEMITLFKGNWSNDDHTESISDECRGCRHDQSVISLICAKRNLIMQNKEGFVTFEPDTTPAIVAMQGM